MTDQTTPRPMDPVCILLGAAPHAAADGRDPAMAALAADLRWAVDGILRAADLLDQRAGSAAGEQP